ncbi:hypothetical protein [Oceanicella sp. SM1341]|uniref:hypothetical protein n=1 Tax=Oceanicella sp. SM1341 TaxID=1548889 RepID=UPI000E4F8F5D|nr:hypothetical protein [Oceanicella sp. SM1341]
MTRQKSDKHPDADRRNAQGKHDGSSHSPEEFDTENPVKQVPDHDTDRRRKKEEKPDAER